MSDPSATDQELPQSQKSCGKIILRLLFSHVGLFLLVIAYASFGAWIFVNIEYDNETLIRDERMIRSIDVNDSLAYLTTLFYYWRDKNMSLDEWSSKVYAELKQMDNFIVHVVTEFNYDGTMNEEEWDREWTFGNGLLYAVTILTTIGYGHVAPNTQLGKIVTILYSLVGIPLTLVFLANIGEAMATIFRWLYSRLCCRWCRGARRRNEFDNETILKMGGRLPTLSTDDVGNEDYMPTEKVQIPIILNLVLISVFILAGAALFAFLEDWDMLSSGYFTFITLTTIGFGDYYPGKSFEGYQGSIIKTLTLMGCCFYMMMGMALVSMCINLMQEQLTTKVKWFANEIGLVKRPDIEDTDAQDPKEKPLSIIREHSASAKP